MSLHNCDAYTLSTRQPNNTQGRPGLTETVLSLAAIEQNLEIEIHDNLSINIL